MSGRRPVTRRPRVYRSAPARRGGKAMKCSPTLSIVDDPDVIMLLSNVGIDVDSGVIEHKFSDFGKVTKVTIHCNKNEARIGTAEVWMSTSKEANKAKANLNATDIFSDGRIIRIEKPKLSTKLSTFWKNVFKYVSEMNVLILAESVKDN